jgi:hypothetical protein
MYLQALNMILLHVWDIRNMQVTVLVKSVSFKEIWTKNIVV